MATEQTAPETDGAAPAPTKKNGSGLIIAALAVVVLVGAGGAGWLFFMRAPTDAGTRLAEAEEVHADPIYYTLADNLVVNFRSPGGTRFLQVGIELMTYDKEGAHKLEKHAPVLRSNLILLLSDQSQDTLLSREGKEALRAEALAEVRRAMTELDGNPLVEALYFTSFVMQ
jgi:flagellar FliL protein